MANASRQKPLPDPISEKQKSVNRAEQISRSNDKVKTPILGLMDIDTTIMYYFDKVIKPVVMDNGELIKVPIRYASPERWSSVQKDGVLRNERGQILLPAVVFRRTSIAKDDTMPQDDMGGKLQYTLQKKYSDKFRYDKFSVQMGKQPIEEFYSVAFPDFQIISYDFVIFTDYIEQMNKIIEKVAYSEGRYWGEPGKFRFKTNIDSFEDATEISTDTDRIVKTTFSISLRGYLLQDNFDYEVLNKKNLSVSKVIVKEGSRTQNIEDIF